jgi:RND family efflux transporter MFP subunit
MRRLMLSLFTTCALLAPQAGSAQQAEFTVKSVQIDDRKAVFGTVESVDETAARSRIGGTIADLQVDEGSVVKAGELIARVGDEKLALELEAIDSRIRAARSQLEQARIDYSRYKRLRESGTISQAAFDNVKTALEVAQGQLDALTAEKAVVAERDAEGAVLAPAAGRVLEVQVTDGQVVLAGETIATIATDNYVLRLSLPERHARFIAEGDKVEVGPRGMSPRREVRREGHVRQVYPEIERGQVIADVEVSGLGDYFVGERVQVFVATGQRRALPVPEDFLFTRFGLTFAKLRDGGDVVVQTGLPIDGGIEVLSGLEPGDVLVRP